MTLPPRPDEDDLPPPPAEDPPGALVWIIAGCSLVLIYVAALAVLHPSA